VRRSSACGGIGAPEDQAIAGFEPSEYDSATVDLRTEFGAAIFGLIATADDTGAGTKGAA
jgi:hypothetical protein